MGWHINLEQAARKVQVTKGFQPNRQDHEVYRKRIAIFERLSTKLTDAFDAIAGLLQNT